MITKAVILLVATFTLSMVSTVGTSYIRNNAEELQEDDFRDEPVYEPRFLPIFQDTASMGKVVQALQNPGNKTLQEELINIVADMALKNFGGDETIKKVVEVVKDRGNKTFQDILMNVFAEVALVKFKGDETIKSIAEILKNPGDEKLHHKLLTLVAEVGDSKLGKDGTLKKVAEVLKKPGNRTLEENLLNVVVEVAISKFGNDQLIRKVAEVFQNSGNKTVQENMLNLATNVALIKFGHNPIVKLVAEVIQNSGDLTIEERLSTAADAALNGALGPVQAALIKQGIGIAGQALKVGGGMLGGTLTKMGGDSVLGKAGQAISNGTHTVGGFMSKFGGGDKGVGLAIEKFGDAMKVENASIQAAFMKAGNVLKGHDAALTNEVDMVKTEGNEDEETDTDDEDAVEDSSVKTVVEESPTETTASSGAEEVIENSASETLEKEPVIETTLVENASPAVEELAEGEQKAQLKDDLSVGITKTEDNNLSVPEVLPVLEDTSDKESVEFSQINPEHGAETADVAVLTGTSTDSFNAASGMLKQRVSAEQSLTGNQILSNTGGSNYGTKVEYGRYPTQGKVVTQSSLKQGGNQNIGALGSASAAIEAARHALEAGSEALGGALGSVAGGSASGQAVPMDIEITTVKLQMA